MADDGDKRNVCLTLTAEGEAMHKALQRKARQLEAQATAGLKTAEREQLLALLAKVRHNLDARDGA